MESIGVKMEMERELKGLSIEEVAKETKISSKYLVALENENYEELPGEAYVKAFLRSYSKYLGLDPEEITQKYDYNKEYDYNKVVKSDTQIPQSDKDKKPINWRLFGFGALGVVVVAGLVWLSVSLISRDRSANGTVVEENVSRPAGGSVVEERGALPPSGLDGQIGFDDNFIYLVATASDEVWISISADGKPIGPASGIILDKGEVRIWRARARFEMSTGNAGGLELQFDGSPVGVLGFAGEVVRGMVFTKNQVKIR